LKASTIQLLRFPFSFFLMPVYWFALSQTAKINTVSAILIFCILHLLVYPSSNGYNSYMDRDTGPIGGIKKPRQPTRQLFYATILFDITSIGLSCLVSFYFAAGMLAYILASKAYSYRGIRLKKYPVTGYLTVIIFQGALIFFLVMYGSSSERIRDLPFAGMLTSSLLIGGFYPLTQIYQHKQDREDGVISLSSVLGYRGSFIFTAIIYFSAMCSLGYYMISTQQQNYFLILQIFFVPVLVYFFWWFKKVTSDTAAANFTNTMKMNLLASFCSNSAFITLFILEKY
jgi:1,4-dihydroxy-2-naphthoate octaprenyltransferase